MHASLQFDRQIKLIAKGPAVLFRHSALDCSLLVSRGFRPPLRQAAEVEGEGGGGGGGGGGGAGAGGGAGVVEELTVGSWRWGCRAAALSDDA